MHWINITILLIFGTPTILMSATTSSLTQYGITWTFSNEIEYGQFINGDYWVVDAGSGVNITGISPGYTDTPRAMNGSTINPSGATHGYDNFTSAVYDAAKNVGIGISPETPLVLSAGDSLVSTISNEVAGDQGGGVHIPYVNSAAVLTVVSSPPASGSFRPGFCDVVAKSVHNIEDIEWTKLQSLSMVSTKPSLSEKASKLQMPWLNHLAGAVAHRYLHPSSSGLDNYYYAGDFAETAIMLHLDYPLEDKKPLAIRYIQLGIDLYSYVAGGGRWHSPDGGHFTGQKWPMLFAGLMLNNPDMQNIGSTYTTGIGNEDDQTFYVSQADVDFTVEAGNEGYTTEHVGMPEWLDKASKRDSSWSATYRNIGTGGKLWGAFATAARIMGAEGLWNNPSFFDYVVRYMAIAKGDPDPFGYMVSNQSAGDRGSALNGEFYDTYWNYATAEPTCSDLTQNGDEEGIDCGGSCPPCETSVLQGLRKGAFRMAGAGGKPVNLAETVE